MENDTERCKVTTFNKTSNNKIIVYLIPHSLDARQPLFKDTSLLRKHTVTFTEQKLFYSVEQKICLLRKHLRKDLKNNTIIYT